MDRNAGKAPYMENAVVSLSARRAWIEILNRRFRAVNDTVALRKESVDRNGGGSHTMNIDVSRSPQGERG